MWPGPSMTLGRAAVVPEVSASAVVAVHSAMSMAAPPAVLGAFPLQAALNGGDSGKTCCQP